MYIYYVTVPSRIKSVTSGGNIDTKKDATIKLNCEADGNPVPNITWTRKVMFTYLLILVFTDYTIYQIVDGILWTNLQI